MQFKSILAALAALSITSASAVPKLAERATGTCGQDSYNTQYYCIIAGVSYNCATGTCAKRSGSEFPCSGSDGTYTCPA